MRKIYHGSVKIIEKPQYGAGRRDNDYGLGFYCTEDIELAKEWAAADERGGFVNCYEVDENGMSYLNLQQVPERRQRLRGAQPPAQMGGGVDLSTEEEVVLQWMAILVDNRSVRLGSPVERRGKEFLCTHLLPDISKYDYLIGYRADDSYFSYARAFLSNTLTVGQLSSAMRLGDLGLQYVIRSPRMFERLRFCDAVPVDGGVYYPKRMQRDQTARQKFRRMLEDDAEEGRYLSDLMRNT
ncbi:MAG: DUF3990 domain-containing protein [Lachnospiraceae bacterium]|nr:DUF3990 domain-containing protein [Lachnospiraceae bacterium]